jgi:hypothetical protein
MNTIIKYTTAAILIMVPLYPKFPSIRIPGTFVSIRLEDFLLAFGAFVLMWTILPRLIRFLRDRITQSALLFIFIGFVSLLSAIFVTHTVAPQIGILHWIRRIEYLVPLFLGMEAIRRNKNDLSFFVKILLIVVTLCFIYGLGQRYFSWPVILTQNMEYSKGVALRWTPGAHINATFAGHYDLSTFLVVALPVIVTCFFVLKGKWSRLVLLMCAFFGLWLLVNSAARISQVSYLGAVTIALFLSKKYIAIPLVLIVSILFIATSSNLISRYMQIFNVYAAEENVIQHKTVTPIPTSIPVVEDRSTNIRLVVEWPRAIRAFTKNPLLGTGYSSITLATDNDYLRLLGEVGLLGFFAFLILWINIGFAYFKVFPYTKHFSGLELAVISGVIGGTFGVFVNAIFIDVFEASKFILLFMLLTGMAIGLVRSTEKTH